MNIIEFLKYWLDTQPFVFGVVVIVLFGGINNLLSNLFYNKHRAKVDSEHEKLFWK